MKRTLLLLSVCLFRAVNAYGDGLTVTVTDPAYGAKCDGLTGPRYQAIGGCESATDDACSINKALVAVGGAGGGEVIIPPGTCIVSLNTPPSPAFLPLYSNMTIRGAGRKSILKIRDNAGNYDTIFGFAGPGVMSNVVLRDFTVDQNPSGNQLADIWCAGKQFVLGAGPARGVTVTGMYFDPIDGSNTIILSNLVDDLQATITNNYFRFAQGRHVTECLSSGFRTPPPPPPPGVLPYYDNSAVYLEGSQQVVTGNIFVSTLDQFAVAAIETHGGRSTVSNNTTNNYATLVNVVPTQPPYTELKPNDIVVSGNSVTCAQQAISLWPTAASDRTIRNLSITGNAMFICDKDRVDQSRSVFGKASTGVWIVRGCCPDNQGICHDTNCYIGNLDGISVTNNLITLQPQITDLNPFLDVEAINSGGIVLHAAGNMSNVLVKGNIVKGSPVSGIRVGASVGLAQRVRVTDNIVVDAANNPGTAQGVVNPIFRHSIGVLGNVSDADIMRNTIYDTGSPTAPTTPNGLYALYLQPSPPPSSKNVRSAQNTVHVNPGTGPLLSSQGSTALTDTTNTSDVLISSITGSPTATLPVDFISFTQYITTINGGAGSLSVPMPSVDLAGGTYANWSVGQLVTFRFLCTASVTCTVTFAPAYSTSGNLSVSSGTGRAITFQVENWAGAGTQRKFFELYRSPPAGVPNP